LSRVHDVLIREEWESARLRDIVLGVTRPLVTDIEARLRLQGVDVKLPAREALGMTMVLHELCTNALKYGAFKTPEGCVDVMWEVQDGPDGTVLNMTWSERDGPPVSPPAGKVGFGTRLIARAFGDRGTARVEFLASGVVACITLLILDESAGSQRMTNAALPGASI
jgi:two-component sensor histidine kinase